MKKAHPAPEAASTAENHPCEADVRAALERILSTPAFQSGPRRREMLRYIVEEKLEGRADRLKGVSIAHAVFGRGDDFDQQTDPVVRIEARRLRRDLDSYYAQLDVREPVRIEVPKGAYVPYFSFRSLPPVEADEDASGTDGAMAAAPITPEPLEEPASRPDAPLDSADPEPTSHPPPISAFWKGGDGWRPRLALLAISCVLAAALIVVLFRAPLLDPEAEPRPDAVVADNGAPGVIVLPFRALSGAAEDAYLAEGITFDLVNSLMTFSGFRLFTAPAALDAKTATERIADAREYPIEYIVEGTLQPIDERQRIRLASRLVSASDGMVIWSETFERSATPGSLISVQTELASEIAVKLGAHYGVVGEDIRNRLIGKSIPSDTAYGCVMQGYAYRRTFDRALFEPTLGCMEEAVRTDPDYADAWAMLAWLRLDGARYDYIDTIDKDALFAGALAAAENALDNDGANVLATKAISSTHHHMGSFAKGEAYAREALALNPNDPDSHAQLGWRLAIRGEFDEGIAHLERAIERTLSPPPWYYALLAVHDLMEGRAEEMVKHARLFARGRSATSYSILAIALAKSGDAAGAREAMVEMERKDPAFAQDPATRYRQAGATNEIVAALMDGLREAGWRPPS